MRIGLSAYGVHAGEFVELATGMVGDGWLSSGTPSFDEARRLRGELLRRLERSERTGDPFRLVFRMEGADPGTARRYEDEGLDEVVNWSDQVWPEDVRPVEAKRDAPFAAADALGLRART